MLHHYSEAPDGMMPPQELESILMKARHASSRAERLRLYRTVLQHIESVCKDNQKSVTAFGTIAGVVVGFLIPLAHIITVPLCGYFGYKMAEGNVMANLAGGPYEKIYKDALKGLLECDA